MNSQKNGIKKSKLKKSLIIYYLFFSFGIDMEPVKVKTNPPQKIIHPIPPYNGYGSEEDSLNNVKHLNFQGKNIEYYVDKFKRDKHILRFLSKLISPIASDEERRFIISFFVKDQSIQIFELAARNSGRQSCKFYDRQRIKNPFTNKYYTEKDCIIGNCIYANHYTFKLLKMDEYTRKYMLSNPEIFRDANVKNVVNRIKLGCTGWNNDFEEFLVHLLFAIDPKGNNYTTKEEIVNGIKSFGIYLSEQEIMTLVDKLRCDEKGRLSMEDLYNYIAAN